MSAGQIYDLGYKRYVGTRRSFETRWQVIMRHQIATAWKGWWRFKVWLIAGMLATAIVGGIMFFSSGRMFRLGLGGLAGELIKLTDAMIPWSTLLYCKVGFAVSLVLCSTTVAGDVQSGAFTFYFARSVRPRDYVIGKLAGLCLLVGLIMLVGPFVLAGVRLGLSDNVDQVLGLLPLLYKALALGAVGTLIYAAVPLGFSAAIANRRYSMAMWAAYYVVIGSMAHGLGVLIAPELGAIDLTSSLAAVANWLFDTRVRGGGLNVPAGAALISILVHTTAAIGLVFWRVRSSHHSGVGGSS
jgi:hypothetical protein